MKHLFSFIIVILLMVACSDNVNSPEDDNVVEREVIEFNNKLGWLERHTLQNDNNIFYVINSADDFDSDNPLFKVWGDYLQERFKCFDFTDSTLVGITLTSVFSSSTNVFIDSLIRVNDSIYVYSHLHHQSIYCDITSPSDIVSFGKRNLPVVWKDHYIIRE